MWIFLTQNIDHGKAGIAGGANNKPKRGERHEVLGESGAQATNNGEGAAADQGRQPAGVVREVSVGKAAQNGAEEEDHLRVGGVLVVVADPLKLHGGRGEGHLRRVEDVSVLAGLRW